MKKILTRNSFTRIAKRFSWLSLIALHFLSSGCDRSSRENTKIVRIGVDSNSYFFSVPIVQFAPSEAPCVVIEIENEKFSASLDLGLKGGISLTKTAMDQIRSKTLVTEIKRHGVSGNVEVMQVYRVSQLDLGPLFFNDIPIFQEGESSRLQSIFLRPGQELSQQEPGRIGWQLFTNTCLLIDVQNRVLACCDSLDTLQERGYDTSRFSSCPLSIERGLVEFMAESPEGPIRCTLDSGATINLRHCDAPPEVSIQDMIFDEKNRGTLSLKIGGRNFGLVGYQSVPIRLPIPMELTLGMEFIETHLIFIDFVRKVIHFAPQAEFELALNKKSSIISAP